MTAIKNDGAVPLPIPVEQAEARRPDPEALYAALDLGTNSCRMLVAQPNGSQFHVIDSFAKSVQLGRGLARHGSLSRASIDRTVAALRVCRKKLDHHKVTRMRLVATEACRRASNGPEFMRKIARETGLVLEIIRPEEEARLAVISCAPLVSRNTEQLLVVDIGGGSTELVWIDLSKVAPPDRSRAIMRLHSGFECASNASPFPGAKVIDWISIPLGVATLKDQFADVREDGPRFALMSCHFEEKMAEFAPYQNVGWPQLGQNFQMIGTSGTVTTVAASHLDLRRYDRNKVDGLRMSTAQVDAVIQQYLEMGPEGRRRDARIGPDRHALILSGVAILQTLIRIWPTDRLSVADRGLREGLLFALMSADGILEDGLV
ncbi:MAG: Ppx/GppA family phosphatase [Alphaproteobacteria bacterium]|nr:Ppx/GppA family phosphatase [Alphaproteobacteria bacterium]